jgi:hypothetical protein
MNNIMIALPKVKKKEKARQAGTINNSGEDPKRFQGDKQVSRAARITSRNFSTSDSKRQPILSVIRSAKSKDSL